jgi:hypothetical protein
MRARLEFREEDGTDSPLLRILEYNHEGQREAPDWERQYHYAATSGPLRSRMPSGTRTNRRALLKQHVDVGAAEPDGTTALHWAAH